jgi:ABC-2 type transport system ATP-binding protein
VLHELTPLAGSLEDAYLALTEDDVEYHAADLGAAAAAPTTPMEQVQ